MQSIDHRKAEVMERELLVKTREDSSQVGLFPNGWPIPTRTGMIGDGWERRTRHPLCGYYCGAGKEPEGGTAVSQGKIETQDEWS